MNAKEYLMDLSERMEARRAVLRGDERWQQALRADRAFGPGSGPVFTAARAAFAKKWKEEEDRLYRDSLSRRK